MKTPYTVFLQCIFLIEDKLCFSTF